MTLDFKKLQKEYGIIDKTSVDGFEQSYVTCQGSVPQAIVAFLASIDFEDAIRNAVAIGGDTDTIAAITGSVAAAYYGVPNDYYEKVLSYLDDGLIEIYNKLRRVLLCMMIMLLIK
mgnify:CR=1 FL=1